MYRSASTNRVTDDNHYSSSSAFSKVSTALRALSLEVNDELPVYEPPSEAAKKERNRAKFAENAIHLIPLLLLFCAFILWFLSNPDINVATIVTETASTTRIEGLTIEGDVDSDGTQTGNLPLELGEWDLTKQDEAHKTSFSGSKFP